MHIYYPLEKFKSGASTPPHAYFDLKTCQTRLTWCDTSTNITATHEEQLQSETHKLWDSMKNRRLMFIGDSITRYQYIALTHFLTTQTWSSEESLVNVRFYEADWTEFYQATTKLNQGMELCECFRPPGPSAASITENRKYVNSKLNTTVWYFKWFGDKSLPHGHFSILEDIQPLDCMPSDCRFDATNHSWIAKSASEFILQFAKAHKPDHVIMNTGLHAPLDGKNEMSLLEGMFWRSHYQQFHKLPTKFIFKSTTPLFHAIELIDNRGLDLLAYQYAANGLWEYWDISSVIYDLYIVYRKLELPYYYYRDDDNHDQSKKRTTTTYRQRGFTWDTLHYHPWIYHELNKLLIRKYYWRY
jgi:hypothetical protein